MLGHKLQHFPPLDVQCAFTTFTKSLELLFLHEEKLKTNTTGVNLIIHLYLKLNFYLANKVTLWHQFLPKGNSFYVNFVLYGHS